MGQDISKSIIPPPLTLQDCFVNGQINLARYLYYRRRSNHLMHAISGDRKLLKKKRKYNHLDFIQNKKQKKLRSTKKYKSMVRDRDGVLRELLPTDTLWYLLYISIPPNTPRMLKLFRRRFRLPYDTFLTLSNEISTNPMFARWNRCDAVGVKPSDRKLLLLGVLRYIGRAWTLDDVAEANGISLFVNRDFLLCFLEYGSTVLYKKWVLDPASNINISERESIFRQAGFDGCIGSSDATHVAMLSCPYWAQNMHKGFKLHCPARTYNVTVDHTRRIIGTTLGHPGTWNDKSVVLFDDLLTKVNKGEIYNDFVFKLYEKDSNGNIVQIEYSGVWFIVDNGYLSWSCTVPPENNGTTYAVIRFSEWLESMRKDVECLFGIMKGRFLILRYGFRLQKIFQCDRIWLTCCAMHNMLLDVDGLHKNWETGAKSDWELSHIQNLHRSTIRTPFAITRLNCHLSNHDEQVHDHNECNNIHISKRRDKYTVNGKRVVSKMPLSLFKQCLVNHFDIRFKKHDIIWPSRLIKPNKL